MSEPLLRDVLSRAQAVPLYKSRIGEIPTSAQDVNPFWKSLPLTTKQDLREQYPFGLLAVPREQLASYHESSGTTGVALGSAHLA